MQRVHQRTLDALMHRELARGVALEVVAEGFGLDLGKLQDAQTRAAQYAAQVRSNSFRLPSEEIGF